MAKELGDEKKRCVWQQTVFPVTHASRMNAFIKSLDPTALGQHQASMRQMQTLGVFNRWVTIPHLWEPDLTILHNFGTLPNVDNKFSGSARRTVKCSPQLANFIEHNTQYKRAVAGPQPEPALRHLLRACFVWEELIFTGPFSAYNLLCTSHLVMDHAFMRAVVAASKWLGPTVFPVGYIANWPPPYEEEQL